MKQMEQTDVHDIKRMSVLKLNQSAAGCVIFTACRVNLPLFEVVAYIAVQYTILCEQYAT